MGLLEEIPEAVADAQNTEPEDLEIALENYIATDSIRLLDKHKSDSWVLEFEIPNHTIRVTGHGGIFVDGAQQRALS
jgi:hypothetical protein